MEKVQKNHLLFLMFPACFAADPQGGIRISLMQFGSSFLGLVSKFQWLSGGQESIGTHWWRSVSLASALVKLFECASTVWHPAQEQSKSTVHLAWFTHHLHDMMFEATARDQKKAPASNKHMKRKVTARRDRPEFGEQTRSDWPQAAIELMQMMFDKAIYNSNSFSLNCLYLLFICCSRQLCSREMATNAGDRLATTGPLTGPSVSGSASTFGYFPHSAHFNPVCHFSCYICCDTRTQIWPGSKSLNYWRPHHGCMMDSKAKCLLVVKIVVGFN